MQSLQTQRYIFVVNEEFVACVQTVFLSKVQYGPRVFKLASHSYI